METLLKGGLPFKWGQAAQKSFEEEKKKFDGAKGLALTRPGWAYGIETDD